MNKHKTASYTSFRSLPLCDSSRRQIVGKTVIPSGSLLKKEKPLKNRRCLRLPEKYVEPNVSDRKMDDSCDDQGMPLPSEPDGMHEERVMHLKLRRVSLETASGDNGKPRSATAWKSSIAQRIRRDRYRTSRSSDTPGSLPCRLGSARNASVPDVQYQLKPKKISSAPTVSFTSVKDFASAKGKRQQTRRGTCFTLTGRIGVTKKCTIVRRRLSFIPETSSPMTEAVDAADSSASPHCTSDPTKCDVSGSVPKHGRGRPKKVRAISPNQHQKHVAGFEDDVRSAGSRIVPAVRPRHAPSSQDEQRGVVTKSSDDSDAEERLLSGRSKRLDKRQKACSNSSQTKPRGRKPRPSSHRATLRRKGMDVKEGQLDHPKRRVGRPRKNPAPGSTSEDAACPSGVVKSPVKREPEINSGSWSEDEGNASEETTSSRQKDCFGSQRSHCSLLLEKAGSCSVFLLKTEAMSIIYPSEALSAHLPNGVMTDTTLSDTTSDVASPACSHEQIVPQQAVDPLMIERPVSTDAEEVISPRETKQDDDSHESWLTQSSHERSRVVSPSPSASKPGRPGTKLGRPRKMRRQEASATNGDLALNDQTNSPGGSIDQIVPERPDNLRTSKRRSQIESTEPCFGEPKQNQCGGVNSPTVAQSPRQGKGVIRTSAPASVAPKRKPGRPRKKQRLGEERAVAIRENAGTRALPESSDAHDPQISHSKQGRKCWIESDGDNNQKKSSQGKTDHCDEHANSDTHCVEATDLEQRQPVSAPRSSSQSADVGASSELGGEQPTRHHGAEPMDAGDGPGAPGQGVDCLNGRVLRVRLLPLSTMLRLELASRASEGGISTTSPSVRLRTPPVDRRWPDEEQRGSARHDDMEQNSETRQEPSKERDGGRSWMGRESPPSVHDFEGFTKEELTRTHGMNSETRYPFILLKDSCNKEASKKPQVERAAPLVTKVPTTWLTAEGEKRYRCNHCNFESSTWETWDNHVRKRHGYLYRKNKHACDKCAFSGRCLSELKVHYTKHTGERPFPCSVCGKSFGRKSVLKNHMLMHSGEKKFVCETCGKAYRNIYRLKLHQKRHTEEKPYRCGFCEKMFRTQTELDNHFRRHTGEKPFRCAHCGKCFSTRTTLVHHTRTHTGEKPYRCDACGKAFALRTTLVNHTYSHLKERNFKCDLCGNSFKAKKLLDIHLKIHTAEKRYKCEVCGKRFLHSSGLKAHSWTHTGDKPFSCDICGRSFTHKRYLIDHFRAHSGEKPFKCETCGTKFRYVSSMKTHIKRFHANVKCL